MGIGTASPSSPLTVESAFDYVANFRSTDTTSGILLTDTNAQCRVTNTNGNLILTADKDNQVDNTAIRFMLDTTSNSGNDARVVIRTAGLGIGTASPSNPLHVYHATTNQLLRLESGDSTSSALFKDNSGEVLYQNVGGIAQIVSNNSGSGTDGIRFLNQSTEVGRFHSNGYLGIGSTSPTVPLDIRQPTNVLLKLSSTTASNNTRISFAPNNDEKWNVGVNVSDAAFTYYDVETASTPIKIEQGASTNAFVLKSTGNIGIGTNSPDRLLDIEGSVPAVRLTDTTTTGMYHEILGDGNSLSIEADDGNVGSGSRIQFKVDGTERARINSSGRLGLNTTNPTTDLEVNASGANGIKITSDQPYLFFNDTDNSGTAYDATISYSGDSLYVGGASAASIIRFRNKASFGESARFDTGGAFLIGTTSNINHAHSHIDVISTINGDINVEGIVIKDNTGKEPQSGSSYTDVLWNDGGDLYWEGDSISSGGSSDIRLKENIEPITDAVAKVKQLNGCTFNFKKNPEIREAGLIAQDVQKVLPEVVYEKLDRESNENRLALKYDKIISLLVESTKTTGTNRITEK